tara:strand:+ start:2750 stop:3373 length:624 start_codon:yes stop_codon:yes gene_type:complete
MSSYSNTNRRSNMKDHKNTIFLDVDGVINSLIHLYNRENTIFDYPTNPHRAGNYTVWVPEYMPQLVQAMEKATNLYWLTTWRDKANEYISPILGVSSELPVINDGSPMRSVEWKFPACLDLAKNLSASGQNIYWVEDFHGMVQSEHKQFLTYVDTDAKGEGVLLPQHLPEALMSVLVDEGGYTGPTHLEAPTTRYRRNSIGARNLWV